ncbi:MAG: RNA polymerase sigma factor [Terriglobales bacterium]
MATRTQVVLDSCTHEQILQASYEHERRHIQTLCRWMMPDLGTAQEMAIRVFVEAWGEGEAEGPWPELDPERLVAAFASHFRSLFRSDGGQSEPKRGPVQARVGSDLRGAVRGLPEPQRLLYLLHELEGYPAATLGVWLGLDETYCARMIHQARRQLRSALAA